MTDKELVTSLCVQCSNLKPEDTVEACGSCGQNVCDDCITTCSACSKDLCNGCLIECNNCSNERCVDCLSEQDCGHTVCEECQRTCTDCRGSLCSNCTTNCDHCGNTVCDSCRVYCNSCNCYTCSSEECSVRCSDCSNSTCMDCSTACMGCDDRFCESCWSEGAEGYCQTCYENRQEDLEEDEVEPALFTPETSEVFEVSSSDTKIGDLRYPPRIPYVGTVSQSGSMRRARMDFTFTTGIVHDYFIKPVNWPKQKNIWENQYFGMEWELNYPPDKWTAVATTVDSYLHGKYIWKYDGSITNRERHGIQWKGSELVIAPISLQIFHTINFSELCKKLNELGVRGYDSGLCGIHIHVNRETISPYDMRKIMGFFMRNRRFIRLFAKRNLAQMRSYAPIPTNLIGWLENSSDRHIAINSTPETWEFRVFRSTTKFDRIKATWHFVAGLIQFAKLHSFASCTSQTSLQTFVNWLGQEGAYKFLRDYLKNEHKLAQGQAPHKFETQYGYPNVPVLETPSLETFC